MTPNHFRHPFWLSSHDLTAFTRHRTTHFSALPTRQKGQQRRRRWFALMLLLPDEFKLDLVVVVMFVFLLFGFDGE